MRLNKLEVMQDKQVYYFVKFTKPEFVQDLLDGNLYMQPLKNFIEQEEREQVRGQGDRLEGAAVGQVENLSIVDNRTGEVVAELGKKDIILRHPDAGYIPVFCFTAFTKDDFEIVQADEEYAYVKLSLPEEDKQKIIENFGKSAVILPNDFPHLVAATIQDEHYGQITAVRYVDYSAGIMYQEQLEQFIDGHIGLAFWKDVFFKFQREFRLAFSTMPTDKAKKYAIGDVLKDSQVLDINNFFDEAIHRMPLK
ncbi:hypothetical protein E6C60_1387 [Paenibacillus algicola]|uniref:Uncharacterized protein n=1 Tax=Paenibacillus algicola TaxID=2565926 RepID=A0A4P8XIQ9_9BACL|nr:hypothetical protein [Paenibacillus algicola]QCT02103.1 hypothetical protein E6C60_1387 [Paenibacillus algicola]